MSITKEDVEQAVRAWAELSNSGNAAGMAAMDAGSAGFGFRSAAFRNFAAVPQETLTQLMERFFGSLELCRMEILELHTAVHSDVGFAWGTYVEEFRPEGGQLEVARARFSQAMVKSDEGWKILSFHREIQPFDAEGRYPQHLTAP